MSNFTTIAEFLRINKRNKRWQKALACMAAVVVFTTTYALILPAITASTTTYCGQKEHIHSDSECYKETKTLTCKLTEGEGHTHTADCYKKTHKLICGETESAGHSHTDACKEFTRVLTCGLAESQEEGAEHSHSDSCYTVSSTIICGQTESQGHTHSDQCYEEVLELICEETEGEPHTHTDDCYKITKELTCSQPEHKHTDICYSNPNADIESAQIWERTFKDVELTGDWSKDVLAIADTQLGYHESEKNYIINENGKHNGYSRYGAWYGDPYGHWCAMFASFCLHYAGVDTAYMPLEASCQSWIEKLNSKKYASYYAVNDRNSYEVLTRGTEYIPEAGDLIFFNWDKEADADHVGLIYSLKYDEDEKLIEIKTIEGNTSNQVAYRFYQPDDDRIMGFAKLPVNPHQKPEEITLTAECEEATAEAVFEKGVFPDGTVMTIALLQEEEEIAHSNDLLAENAKERNLEIIKNYLFDISFSDKEGKKLEPDGNVKVSISIRKDESEELIPEDEAEPITWELVHITDDGEAEVLTEEHQTSIEVSDTNMLQTVSFENDGFSEYSVQAVQGVSLLADGEAGESYTNMSPESNWLSHLPVTLPAGTKGTYVHPSSYYQHYQASSHAVRLFGEETYYTPDLFTLVEKQSNSAETWTPNSIYYSPSANYDVVYCADYRHQPGTDAAYIYKDLITDSTVVQSSPEPAISNTEKRRLCAVVANSYPYVSAQSMIAAAGLTGTGCTESECLIAAQIVIWRITNPAITFDYGSKSQSYKNYLGNNATMYYQLNPIPNSRCNWTTNGVTNATVANYVNTLIKYLVDIGDAAAQNPNYIYEGHSDLTITNMEISSIETNSNGVNSVTVGFELDRNLTGSETITAVLKDPNGNIISETLSISSGSNAGEITFRNVTSLPEEIELYLESDYTTMGVYYYTYGNSNDSYQRMIGARPTSFKHSASAKAPGMTSVSVRKNWVGGSDYPSINITLYRNGEPIDTAELSGNSDTPWYHIWTLLLSTDEAGNRYEYTVTETDTIPGFEKGEAVLVDTPYLYNGQEYIAATNYEITNTSYEVYKTTISASKIWEGDGDHPGSIQIQLKQDGEVIDTAELSGSNHWFKKWEELPKYKSDGSAYQYEVVEVPVAGYISNITVTVDKSFVVTEDATDPVPGKVPGLVYVDSIVGNAIYITNTDYGVLTAKGGKLAWESFEDAISDPYASWKISKYSTNSSNYQYYWQNNGSGQYLTTTPSSLSLASNRSTILYNSGKQIYYTYSSWGRDYTVLFDGSFSGGKGGMSNYGVYLYPMIIGEVDGIVTPGKDAVETETGDLHFNITNTKIVIFDITLKKVDSTDQTKILSGAAFDLYMQSDSAETVVPTLTGVTAEKIGSYTTGEDGTIAITNLTAGITYYLYETTAPDGYTRNGSIIEFHIDSDGNVILHNDGAIASAVGPLLTVTNTPGVVLPNTGGIGTYMYTLAGLLLILVALCLGYIKKVLGAPKL